MRHRLYSLSDETLNRLPAYDSNPFADNNLSRSEMKRLVRAAIRDELTEKQKFCVIEYFFKSRKMKDIACDLGVNPSTVTRHIQSAKRRIRRVARYY